jgi:serine/threonine protein kinase
MIEREIGSGGMATVHLVMDLKHGRRVALKVLRSELAATLGAERFLREIRITARLNHPHILPLLDSGHADGFLYYVMPYVAGVSLRGLLNAEEPLTIDQIIRITVKVASALGHAHRAGVIHRDIKPENILFSEGLPVVADFGIAKAVSAAGPDNLTRSGFPLGTPGYMSPEQAAGRIEADERTDVCGLACVVYEMLVGDTPGVWPVPDEVEAGRFAEVPHGHRERLDRLPGSVEQVLVKALAIRPAQRFASPMEFAKALAHAAERSEILDDAETREILGRAVELQAQLQSEEEKLSLGAVEQVAAEVGIEPERVRQAAGELARPSAQVPVDFTRQGSKASIRGGKLRFQRETDGEITEETHQTLVDEIDARLGIVGRISPFGKSLTWSPAAPSDEERNVVVKITPQDGRTRIYVEERVEMSGWQQLIPVFGIAAGAAFGLFLGAALQGSERVMGFSALGFSLVGAFVAVKVGMWRICNRRRPELEKLANRLTEIAAMSKWAGEEM